MCYFSVEQVNELMREWREIDPDTVDELCSILKPFKDVTTVISTESSVTVSLIRPLLFQLMSGLRVQSSNPSLREFRETIRNNLEKR